MTDPFSCGILNLKKINKHLVNTLKQKQMYGWLGRKGILLPKSFLRIYFQSCNGCLYYSLLPHLFFAFLQSTVFFFIWTVFLPLQSYPSSMSEIKMHNSMCIVTNVAIPLSVMLSPLNWEQTNKTRQNKKQTKNSPFSDI